MEFIFEPSARILFRNPNDKSPVTVKNIVDEWDLDYRLGAILQSVCICASSEDPIVRLHQLKVAAEFINDKIFENVEIVLEANR